MKAIRIHKHGSPDVLKIDDIPEPAPGENEVKIQVKATSLNHMDIWVRKGIPGIGALPLVLGCDAAGVVVAVGDRVIGFKPGDRVFVYPMMGCGACGACESGRVNLCPKASMLGEHVDGTHREFLCLGTGNVIRLSDKISFDEGAAFPLVFLTAWHMLVQKGGVKKGDTVLVVGAASGVGSAAVQIAKLFGARVIATAGSADKLAHAKELGAEAVIDHYRERISTRVKEVTEKHGADIIVEHVGAKVWQECLKSLAWGGRLVTCGATTGPNVSLDLRHVFIKHQQIIGSTMGTYDELVAVHEKMARRQLKAVVSKVFPYKDVQEAHRYLEASQHFGKVVLRW